MTDFVSVDGTNSVQNGLQLDSNAYLHSTILPSNWRKFLPVPGSLIVNHFSYEGITDSDFIVPNLSQRPSPNTDITDKLFVDSLTNYVLQGSLTRASGGLTTYSNVPLLASSNIFVNSSFTFLFQFSVGIYKQVDL